MMRDTGKKKRGGLSAPLRERVVAAYKRDQWWEHYAMERIVAHSGDARAARAELLDAHNTMTAFVSPAQATRELDAMFAGFYAARAALRGRRA